MGVLIGCVSNYLIGLDGETNVQERRLQSAPELNNQCPSLN